MSDSYQEERNITFDKRWEANPSTGCWDWKEWAATRDRRYGALWDKRKGCMVAAHRFSYERFIGNIPAGMVVRHKCDNGFCVNPEHLELGTQQDNVKDCLERGRMDCRKGVNNGRSKLSEEDVVDIYLSEETIPCLAIVYNVHVESIRAIKNGTKWRHVTIEYDPK